MKRFSTGVLLLAAVLMAQKAVADSIDFDLHSEALRLVYTMDMSTRGHPGLTTDFGVLFSQDEKYLDDLLLHAGLHVTGENWSEAGSYNISLGARAVFASPGNTDVAAIPLGVSMRFSPIHRVGIGGSVYYAPKIISFLDIDTYREMNLRGDYQVLPQAFVYVGYRYIDVNIDDGPKKVKLENRMHVGFRLLF